LISAAGKRADQSNSETKFDGIVLVSFSRASGCQQRLFQTHQEEQSEYLAETITTNSRQMAISYKR